MKMTKELVMVWLIGMAVLAIGCEDGELGALNDPNKKNEVEYTWAATADSMQEATINVYLTSEGTFRENNQGNESFHYWRNAHMVDVLVDGYLRSGEQEYITRAKALLLGIKSKNNGQYPNDFIDDMAWLAIACTRAYEVSDEVVFLDASKLLWEEILRYWSDVYGGGITWKINTPNLKNAVSNAPVAILSLRLYAIENDTKYLDWAKDIYAWQKNNLVDPNTGLVWDHIDLIEGEPVVKKEWIFTYNIGTWIGAATELYQVTGEQSYLNDAVKTANSMMTSPQLTTEGMLRDEGQGDGGLFKGILVRYFTRFIELPALNEDRREDYIEFLRFNGETLYEDGIARPSMLCGPNWRSAPSGTVDFSTQLSGIMLIEAMARLEEGDYL
ncbi:glycoside hydrolase family 76 protein [Marinoscillum sp.]|uniref:glycoside hydrolase family 76 protein n=1 Tax=Marinoscillum sp. TaxID=2024838 RepID=UPI003BAAAFBD